MPEKMKTSLVALLIGTGFPAASASEPSTAGMAPTGMMELAVLPLPLDMRAQAGLVRWADDGILERLKMSGNGFSCSVDDPDDDVFDVRCYADEFWKVIEYNRGLAEDAVPRAERTVRIEREIDEGRFQLPTASAGYRMFGPISAINLATGEVGEQMNDWQSIHFPFQTSAQIGLTEADEDVRQDDPMPFVMASGTWWSHVMIMHGTWKPLEE